MIKSKIILVNAVSAKYGGAKTILDGFANNLDDNHKYIIISGYKADKNFGSNIQWLYLPLSGFFALLFNLFFVISFYFYFKANLIISFNNINTVFPISKFTYFHQMKIFDLNDNSLKVRIYRLYFNLFKNDHVVVQTDLVKEKFCNNLDYLPEFVTVVWPGVSLNDFESNNEIEPAGDFVLVPYSCIEPKHKNFEFVQQFARLNKDKFRVVVTARNNLGLDYVNENIDYIGNISHNKLLDLFSQAKFVLFPSNQETIGLPIFEAISVGCPVVATRAEYIEYFCSKFDFNGLLILVDSPHEVNKLTIVKKRDLKLDFINSEWNKLFELLVK